jgi:hypothetical protein
MDQHGIKRGGMVGHQFVETVSPNLRAEQPGRVLGDPSVAIRDGSEAGVPNPGRKAPVLFTDVATADQCEAKHGNRNSLPLVWTDCREVRGGRLSSDQRDFDGPNRDDFGTGWGALSGGEFMHALQYDGVVVVIATLVADSHRHIFQDHKTHRMVEPMSW